MANWPRDRRQRPAAPRPATPARTAPSASPTSRARRSRRSPSPGALQDGTRHARHDVRPAAADPGRRPRRSASRTTRGPVTLTTAQILAQSSNVGAITIGLRMGKRRASTTGCARFGFGKPTGVDLPGEERGLVLPARASTRAPRWATCRSARAWPVTPMQMAHGLRGDRQRRHPAPAARRPPRRRQAASPTPKGTRIISAQRPPRSCARCSRASSRPAARRARSRSPATSSPARPARRTRSTRRTGEYSESHYVASFVGFAPALHPKLLIARDGRRAAGRDLRRRGRRAGLRQDRRASPCRTCGSRRD